MSEFDTLEFRGDGVYCACGGLIFGQLPAEGSLVRCAVCGNAWLYNGGSFEMKCEIGQPAVTTATLRMERVDHEDRPPWMASLHTPRAP